jgi:3-dehydroquinate synthetase
VAHGARPCSGDALQLITGHHHHRHALIATGAAEVGGQIGCRLKVLLTAEAFGTLQHHVAARAFLSMEPEIAAAGLPMAWPELDPEAVLQCLQGDKKVRDGQVRFVLPTGIGSVEIRNDVSASTVVEALKRI